jgi:flagellar biosynthesis protein FlhF
MKTHRFTGATSREVLNKVKLMLGEDAMILSNRSVDGAIEVVAVAGDAIEEERPTPRAARAARAPAAAPRREFADALDDDGYVDGLSRSEPRGRAASRAPASDDALPSNRGEAEMSAAFIDFVRRNERPRNAAEAEAAPAPVRQAAPAAVYEAPQLAAPAPAVAVASSVAIPAAYVSSAMTRATVSPAIIIPPVASHALAAMPAPVAPAAVVAPAPAAAPAEHALLNEIKTLKSMLQQRDFAAFGNDATAGASGRPAVMHELLSAGFSPYLARRVADEVCSFDNDPTIDQVAECIERELWIAGDDEIVNNGGIYALVGPTGVGKTTTVAKLAARAVVRFGASKVALLTTDSYRVGAHDQLRIYGRILGVPVHAVRDGEELASVLANLTDRHLVLIDTIGMSQRDQALAEQAAMLSGSADVKRLLLVQTTANARTLDQVVTAYKKTGVEGCILTKTDEAASIGPALDVVIRHQLPVHYVTDGQRVPEDLQLPDAMALVREALAPADDAEAFDIMPDELPFMMPSMPRDGIGADLG